MLVASELRGELARIRPARACCRRAELVGLLQSAGADGGVRTLDHATARIAVQLAASIGVAATAPRASATGSHVPGRHHLKVALEGELPSSWELVTTKACDRRAFLRGLLLSAGSVSGGPGGPHVEFVLRDRRSAHKLQRLLQASDVRGSRMQRREREVVYLKGQEEIAGLLRLVGANRALLDFETSRVSREVRNRLNRLLNAEEANLARTVRAADRQLQAIGRLEAGGELDLLAEGLREAAAQRRRQPDADLDTLATSLGISRSAMNHRLRRLVELAADVAGARGARADRS
ncbi:MAG: DNA-binding protein WhiA [Chloroflexi bacterium]|nr:DNA-binding protein WhiA [Chloroflexota bacterium]